MPVQSKTQKSTLLPTALHVLTISQNASAAGFSIFLICHLSSPLSAAFAPKNRAEVTASSFMVLGRVLYQGSLGEPIFVFGALGVHLLSGIGKRIVKNLIRQEKRRDIKGLAERSFQDKGSDGGDDLEKLRTRSAVAATASLEDEEAEFDREEHEDVKESEEDDGVSESTTNVASMAPINFHQKTGYLLVIPLLAHVQLHRFLPASLSPPITSFFSFSFVSYTLSSPDKIVSAASYAVLVGLATYHGLVGARILLNPIAPRSLKPSRRGRKAQKSLMGGLERGWQGAFVVTLGAVGLGLARLGSEGKNVPTFMANRYAELLRRGKLVR